MSVQTFYSHSTPIGVAGGIMDLSPYAIDTRQVAADTGKMKPGMGAVAGVKPGIDVNLPEATSVAANFEGIVVNGGTTEHDLEGKVVLKNGASVGVMHYGRIHALISEAAAPAYGDALYLIIEGNEAGRFTNSENDGTTIAVKGRFLGAADSTSRIAPVELFNQAQ